MDVSHLLDKLNDAQRQAVSAPLAPTLVLAGAGSGKTRVLTHRVAWLVEIENVSPHGILAVTFTNKAAGEMRARIEHMLSLPSAPLWIGTFHGIAHRLLRMHFREAKLPQTFQIIDAEDQQRLIRKLLKALNLDESRWVPKEVVWFVNAQKDEGLRPAQLRDEGDPCRRHGGGRRGRARLRRALRDRPRARRRTHVDPLEARGIRVGPGLRQGRAGSHQRHRCGQTERAPEPGACGNGGATADKNAEKHGSPGTANA